MPWNAEPGFAVGHDMADEQNIPPIPPELERAIDSFRREHDLPSRADAILELIRRGLSAPPSSADSPKPHGDKLEDAVDRATSRPVVVLGEPEEPDER